MNRALERAKRFYQPHLQPEEQITAVRTAIAAGTGSKIISGAVIGTLVGWLLAVNADTPFLPQLVLGALVGVLVGYLLAERAAHSPGGPGTVHLELVLTSNRLLTVPRFAALRRRVLREYSLDDIVTNTFLRYPIGNYHLLEITRSDGQSVGFVVDGILDLPVN